MTKTRTKPVVDKSTKRDQSSKARTRSHMTIPTADLDWALNQSPTVLRLFSECWKSDPYGSRWMPLTTKLRDRNLRGAKKVLRDAGLFDFKTETRVLEGKQHYETMVINLHGSRTVYWKQGDNFLAGVGNDSANEGNGNTAIGIDNTPIGTLRAEGGNDSAGVELEIITEQAFQNLSGTFQEHLKNSSKEFLRCVSSTPNKISQSEETAHAPFGGASPQSVEGVKEKEVESPVAMDCTTLTLVDAVQSNPASLLAENLSCGVEPRDCHEGEASAAPSVPPLQTLTNAEIFNILDSANLRICPSIEAIAVLMKTPHARSLMGIITNNPQWGINLSDYSTVPQDFSQNSKLRQERLNRLKSYALIGECPPDEFLQECQNDPVLAIQIKRMASQKLW
ncbi:hypothetical protein VF14_02950 [Nostoc linckia z18]|uniref:Uncharacterized protein n=2 Tax=Nostoc linckia TaxID=92942 RepID=A0A9Q5ZGQ7_NOSLI|nr:hypothetical protein [Nostoc linckia]PHK42342.1 hypothetical protein VF12_02965 [Nostoc linckia z15]PHK46783.1 hypothetical protein VF13_08835 [Nostoc linckia z16]PHJ69112.1 hypothetical protein VF02_00420 [Nostoc linckia z1]PHJ73263.1 hypothetical protein VF05_01435 [Nostoc linckia z3]PHJ78610.1 hypothetical protein VF03_00420 [Nostoc linckia z2]